MMRSCLFLATLSLLCGPAFAATPEAPLDIRVNLKADFSSKPQAEKAKDGIAISFAADKATDVEVAILDAKGRVIRHLAAGLLGKNAPAPLKKGSLSQKLFWNMKDDAGKAVSGPGYQVRVRLGSRARLQKHVGWNGNTLSSVVGMAVGPKSELYVLTSGGGRGRCTMRVLDKDGKYLRMVMPYPANTPAKRADAIGRITVDGKRIPILFNGHGGNVEPLTGGMKRQSMCFSPKGHIILFSAVGTIVEHNMPRYLMAFHPQGGAAENTSFLGPMVRKGGYTQGGGSFEGWARTGDNVITSSDGKYVYYTYHIYSGQGASEHSNAVFRSEWKPKIKGELFLGKKESGSDDQHFNDPQGIALDKAGNIYVADRGNNRVMIFGKDRKLLGKFSVATPEQIFVHKKSGQIYLTSRAINAKRKRPGPNATIRKFSAWQPGKTPVEITSLSGKGLALITLDQNASPVRLWGAFRGKLVIITDSGKKLQGGPAVNNRDGLIYPSFMAADPANDRVIVDDSFASRKTLVAVSLKDSKKTNFLKSGTDVAVDKNSNVYVLDGYGSNTLSRYDSAGKPLPFASTGKHKLSTGIYRGYGPDLGMRGIEVALNGDFYVFRSNNYALEDKTSAKVDRFASDGKKIGTVIKGLGHGDCGLGVDAAGNVYVGVNLKPADKPIPAAFVGQVSAKRWLNWHKGRREESVWHLDYYNPYLFHFGAVMKFGKEGGTLWGHKPNGYRKKEGSDLWDASKAPAEAVGYKSGYLYKDIKVQGAKWRYPECGIIPTSDANWGDPACVCMTSDLDADPWGRVYVPNAFRFTVDRLDTAGNLIERIGGYGNADSAGPGSKIPQPEIAFVSPVNLDVALDGKLYVSDWTNQRVTQIKFEYSAEAVTSLP
jgi:NHL repeat